MHLYASAYHYNFFFNNVEYSIIIPYASHIMLYVIIALLRAMHDGK